jgi:hydroxymethylbilane synthase
LKSPERIIIASRVSRLAMWQAEHVRDALAALYPACRVEILGMSTRGDEILDRSLAKIGGKGLFVKELENALEDGRADIAVHSAKDVPMDLPAGFTLAAFLAREDSRDALVSNLYERLADLPAGAVVGTSSLRREAQLRSRFPGLDIQPLRGNLDTRLAKLDRGEYAAIVLAVAGLKRLGLGNRIRAVLDPEESLPAVGQGALAIECRDGRPELVAALAPLHDAATAAHAELTNGALELRGLVASPDGKRIARGEARGDASAPERVGEALAAALRARGADKILAELR